MKKVFAVVLLLLFSVCTNNKIAGTTDETVTGTSAMLHYANGSPVAGATVKLFDAGDTTRKAVAVSTSNANGVYSFDKIQQGTYNIWAEKDTLVAFQDSVLVYNGLKTIKDDTVLPRGSITATIGMQPNHDPRTAFVQIIGSERYTNVDSSGRFTLTGLANGTYNIRITTSEPDYTPTFYTIKTQTDASDTMHYTVAGGTKDNPRGGTDTLWLIYTGLPVVTGLSAAYDTSNGIVHLWWKRTAYRNFQDYLIFRDPYDSIRLSANAIASSADTFYVDTIFNRNIIWGDFSFNDTNNYKFKYRVCVESNSQDKGITYKYLVVNAISPTRGPQILDLFVKFPWDSSFVRAFKEDSIPAKTSMAFIAVAKDSKSSISQIVWAQKILTDSTTLKTTQYSNQTLVSDTLNFTYSNPGYYILTATATIGSGNTIQLTHQIMVRDTITP
jgi:hypothetical protein